MLASAGQPGSQLGNNIFFFVALGIIIRFFCLNPSNSSLFCFKVEVKHIGKLLEIIGPWTTLQDLISIVCGEPGTELWIWFVS